MNKAITCLLLFMFMFAIPCVAQPPVTNGLKLYVEAAKGFSNNGASAATWQDQSPANNHLTAGSASIEPTLVANAAGSGFAAIQFTGNGTYMTRLAANTSGLAGTSATLFVVRICNTANTILGNPSMPPSSQNPTMLSIGEKNSFNNEFVLIGDWAMHCTSSGVWSRKTHQCYSSLPNDKPVVVTAALNTGTGNADVNYYVNGIQSTNSVVFQSTPSPFPAVQRSIIIGGRYDGSRTANTQGNTWLDGYVLEALAYERLLSPAEIDSVNKYLKCKYQIKYASCNVVPNCTAGPTPGPDTVTTSIELQTCRDSVFAFGKHTVNKSGVYVDTFKSAAGKDSIVRLSVVFKSRPKANFRFNLQNPPNEHSVSFIDMSSNAVTHLWSFGDGKTSIEKDPVYKYSSLGYYNACLRVTSGGGCQDSICIRVPVLRYEQPQPTDTPGIAAIDVPTAFSPNGDGRNDILFVYGTGIKEMRLSIYNRWGALIFESRDQKNGWDGSYKGTAQDVDVVAYVLEAVLINGEKVRKKGNITIVR